MKKALIICYYWPPAGGPGVQRWLKFVKYLREFEVEPVVYIPENPDYPILDESLVNEIPEDVSILKHPIWEPYKMAQFFSKKNTKQISSGIIKEEGKQSLVQKLMLFIRGNLFIPDARKFWVKPSVTFLNSYLKDHRVDCIITTGPPHSLHLIGWDLKKLHNLPWIADFRDPWTSIGYHKKLRLTKFAQRKHADLEFQILNEATQILVTSPTTKSDFEKTTNTPVTCITNGFDDEKVMQPKLDPAFSLAHIGSLLEDRNPKVLWEILSELKTEIPTFGKDLKIELIGRVGEAVKQTIIAEGLADNLKIPGYIMHQEALIKQRSAQILLLLEIDSLETQAIIPGKLFEYLAARRPILAIGPVNSDITSILEKADGGIFFTYREKQRLKAFVLTKYEEYKSGGISQTNGNLEQFTRKVLTAKLAELIHTL